MEGLSFNLFFVMGFSVLCLLRWGVVFGEVGMVLCGWCILLLGLFWLWML